MTAFMKSSCSRSGLSHCRGGQRTAPKQGGDCEKHRSYIKSLSMSEDLEKMRGSLTNEWGRMAGLLWPSETEWVGMFWHNLSCQGEGYAFISMHTLSSLHSSIPGLCCKLCVEVGTPLSWLGSNTKVSHLTGWIRDLVAPVSYSWIWTEVSLHFFFFCLFHLPLAQHGLLLSLIPLSGTLWRMCLSFNYQQLLFIKHIHTHTLWMLVHLCGHKYQGHYQLFQQHAVL